MVLKFKNFGRFTPFDELFIPASLLLEGKQFKAAGFSTCAVIFCNIFREYIEKLKLLVVKANYSDYENMLECQTCYFYLMGIQLIGQKKVNKGPPFF